MDNKIYLNKIAALEEIIEQLKNENKTLKTDVGFHPGIPFCLRLTRLQAKVLGIILKKETASRTGIYTLIYGVGADSDSVDQKLIDVVICQIRKKLNPHGIIIDTHYCLGYSMSRENKEKVKQLISKEKGIAA